MYKIKWEGCNTQKNIWWKEKADSYRELWLLLCDKRVTHYEDYEEYLFKKYNINNKYFLDEENEYDDKKYNDFFNTHDLEENEYKELIKLCNGNAYYQWFYEWNEELSDYIKI